jgi:hypothetical protein
MYKIGVERTETQELPQNGRRDFEAERSGRMRRWRDLLGLILWGASCSAEGGKKDASLEDRGQSLGWRKSRLGKVITRKP